MKRTLPSWRCLSAAFTAALGLIGLAAPASAQSGACCIIQPTGQVFCSVRAQPNCVADGGTWLGPNTVCTATSCGNTPQIGACCAPMAGGGYTCFITHPLQCTGAGMIWRGLGSTCTNSTCPPPSGACCFTGSISSFCEIRTRGSCVEQGGAYQGDGVACTPGLCPTPAPLGACCAPLSSNNQPTCFITLEAQCTGPGHQWRGVGSTCTATTCAPPPPAGACCLGISPAGVTGCIIATAAQCEQAGGNWLGANTQCGPQACPSTPRGACCIAGFAGNFCAITTRADCEASTNGHYFGDGTSCAGVDCDAPTTGACCIFTPASPVQPAAVRCEITSQDKCADAGGVFRGNGTVCSNNICPPPNIGACCRVGKDGVSVCSVISAAQCEELGGSFRGPGTLCTPTVCVPRGACCIPTITPNGTTAVRCELLTAAQCQEAGGTFRGHGTVCSNSICPTTPPGACCLGPDSPIGSPLACILTSQQQCAQLNGSFRGSGTACTPDTCARGACCYLGFNPSAPPVCEVMSPTLCQQIGGTYRGNGSTCMQNTCIQPPPPGRCCLRNGRCAILTENRCFDRGGIWGGTGTCDDPTLAQCPVVCACDWNGNGRIDDNDLRSFVNDWLNGNADFDRDGDTDNTDLIDFITCWTQPPDSCAPPAPRGACCIPTIIPEGPFCFALTEAECEARGGVYRGDRTLCGPGGQCPPQ